MDLDRDGKVAKSNFVLIIKHEWSGSLILFKNLNDRWIHQCYFVKFSIKKFT